MKRIETAVSTQLMSCEAMLRREIMEMLYRLTEEEYGEILAFKRDLHMHPELAG